MIVEKSKHKVWIMPKWMEPYRPFIVNTGGNSVECLMNDRESTVVTNAPLALICVAVGSQVSLLERLKDQGMLSEKGK